MRTRTKLKPEDFNKIKGSIEAHQYRFDPIRNLYIKHVRNIRGLVAARNKANKYHLCTDAGTTGRMFLTVDGKLSYNRKEAKLFYEGFDEPDARIKHWSNETKVKLYVAR